MNATVSAVYPTCAWTNAHVSGFPRPFSRLPGTMEPETRAPGHSLRASVESRKRIQVTLQKKRVEHVWPGSNKIQKFEHGLRMIRPGTRDSLSSAFWGMLVRDDPKP